MRFLCQSPHIKLELLYGFFKRKNIKKGNTCFTRKRKAPALVSEKMKINRIDNDTLASRLSQKQIWAFVKVASGIDI